jgi:hypothetical protein
MRSFHNSSFDPQTLVLLETAFDEAWLTLKSVGNRTVKPDELARSVLRTAMEGERDPVRLHDGALERLLPATTWREASWSRGSAQQGVMKEGRQIIGSSFISRQATAGRAPLPAAVVCRGDHNGQQLAYI